MSGEIAELIQDWEGIGVVSRYDSPTRTWLFVVLHDDTLGPALGGSRMKVYPTPADGLADGMRLARGMTHKWAAIEAPYGGGKAVLALDHELEGDERMGLLRRYAELLNSLGGVFSTGQDLGTTPDDIAFLAEHSPYIHGGDEQAEDPSPYTARGVFAGIAAAISQVNETPSLEGVSVLVQGAGSVGGLLAELLADVGAAVMVSDVVEERAEKFAARIGGEVVRPDEVYTTPCDVYAPCAIGATLNEETIPQLKCRIVAGSANNQLAEPSDAIRLHERGILYAPDYMINGGGAIALGPLLHAPEAERNERVAGIGEALAEVFAAAAEHDESPALAVRRRVQRVLDDARGI